MKSIHRKLLCAVCAVISFIALFLVLYLPVQPKGNVIAEGWEMRVGDDWRPVSFPFQQPITETTTLVFRTQMSYTPGDAMILTGLKGQAVRILAVGNPAQQRLISHQYCRTALHDGPNKSRQAGHVD